jgi:hypothetical protein
MTDVTWEKISNARLRNVWISGHIDALQETIKMLDEEIAKHQFDDALGRHFRAALDLVKDRLSSKLILALDTQRRLREES